MILRTEAIVLRIAPFSRTSHVVTWLSPEYGRLVTVVKGACRPKSAFLGQYDLFATNELLFYRHDHDGLHAIRECTSLVPRYAMRTDWRRITTASYLADLTARVAQPAQESADLFQLLGNALDNLCQCTPDSDTILQFELSLLRQQGLLPRFEPCPTCHTLEHPWLRFSLPAGRASCVHAAATSGANESGITIHREVLAHLQRLADTLSKKPAPPHLSLGSRRFLGIFMRFHLDTPPAPRRLAFELLETDPATFGGIKGESR